MGAKKKKSLTNKLAKMSDEERARYLQHRADIEEEHKRKKEELICTFLNIKIKKEEEFSRLNLAKINQFWHQLLRKEKCVSLKNDIGYIQQSIEISINSKDRTISFLLQELDESDEQYRYNYQNHIVKIEEIIDKHNLYIMGMYGKYEQEQIDMIERANSETDLISFKSNDDISYLKTLIFSQQVNSKNMFTKQYEHLKSKMIITSQQNDLEINELHNGLANQMSSQWRQVMEAIETYSRKADIRRAHLAELTSLDAHHARSIVKDQLLIERKEKQITALEKEQSERVTSFEEKKTNLLDTITGLRKRCLQCKTKLADHLKADTRRFNQLAYISNNIIEKLTNLLGRVVNIMNLSRMCRKLECEIDWKHQTKCKDLEESLEEDGNDVVDVRQENMFDCLENIQPLWNKYNFVLLTMADLRSERRHLLSNIEETRSKLKGVLENAMLLKHNKSAYSNKMSILA